MLAVEQHCKLELSCGEVEGVGRDTVGSFLPHFFRQLLVLGEGNMAEKGTLGPVP